MNKREFRLLANGTAVLIALVLSMFACLLSADDDPLAGRHRCALDPSKMITLAENGKACAEIVVGTKPCPVVKFAAQELKMFLDQATGADFKIVNQKNGETPAIFPSEAFSITSTRSLFSLGNIAWVSGSPKRALNSRTNGPSLVTMMPA